MSTASWGLLGGSVANGLIGFSTLNPKPNPQRKALDTYIADMVFSRCEEQAQLLRSLRVDGL